MSFSVSHTPTGEVARIVLTGELDMATAPELTTVIEDVVQAGAQRLLVDLSDLEFCDSTGMAAFVRGDNLTRARGGWLRLTGAGGTVDRVLRVSGLADLLYQQPEEIADPVVLPDH
ncbi:STAS domain-containing protein [Plantactinospora sp. GCM10030261]|uniref:STAS domain-containing protein n=1 Tax=Plantactinospora sp. GCM10030261 TaxID=3273420 RepID=UPI003609C95B